MQHTNEVHTQAAGSLFLRLRQTGERSHSVNLHQLKDTKDFLEKDQIWKNMLQIYEAKPIIRRYSVDEQ